MPIFLVLIHQSMFEFSQSAGPQGLCLVCTYRWSLNFIHLSFKQPKLQDIKH